MSDLTQNALAAKRVGQYLIDASVLTREQLDEALDRQRRMSKAGFHVLLGTILEEMGAIDRQSLEAIILRQRLDEGSVNLGGEIDWSPFRPVVEPPAAKANGHSYVNHSSAETDTTPAEEDTSQEKAMLPSETPDTAVAPVNLHTSGNDSVQETATFQALEQSEVSPATAWPEPKQETVASAQREVQPEPSWRERLPRFPFGDRKGEQSKDTGPASSEPEASTESEPVAESTFVSEEPAETEVAAVTESTFVAAEEPSEPETLAVAESTFVAAEEPSEPETLAVAESTFVVAEEPSVSESSAVDESTFVAAEEPAQSESSAVAESNFVAAEEPFESESSAFAESATGSESATEAPDVFSSTLDETYAAAYAPSQYEADADEEESSTDVNLEVAADQVDASNADATELYSHADQTTEPAASTESQTDETNYSGGNDVSRSQASFVKYGDESAAQAQGTVEIKGFQFTRVSDGLSESEVSGVIAQLVNRTRTLEAQMEDAKESLSHLDSMRRYGEESVKAADAIAEDIRSEAEKQSAAIRERAQMEARRIVLEARTQHDEILHSAGEKAQKLASEISSHIDEHREVNNRLIERAEELLQTNTTGDVA